MMKLEEIGKVWDEICRIYDSESIYGNMGHTVNGDKITEDLNASPYHDLIPETLATIAAYKLSVHDQRIYGRVEKWVRDFNIPEEQYKHENISRCHFSSEYGLDHIHTAHLHNMIDNYVFSNEAIKSMHPGEVLHGEMWDERGHMIKNKKGQAR